MDIIVFGRPQSVVGDLVGDGCRSDANRASFKPDSTTKMRHMKFSLPQWIALLMTTDVVVVVVVPRVRAAIAGVAHCAHNDRHRVRPRATRRGRRGSSTTMSATPVSSAPLQLIEQIGRGDVRYCLESFRCSSASRGAQAPVAREGI